MFSLLVTDQIRLCMLVETACAHLQLYNVHNQLSPTKVMNSKGYRGKKIINVQTNDRDAAEYLPSKITHDSTVTAYSSLRLIPN